MTESWYSDERTIAENIRELRERIAAAAAESGRDAGEVRLMAVTKISLPCFSAFLASRWSIFALYLP